MTVIFFTKNTASYIDAAPSETFRIPHNVLGATRPLRWAVADVTATAFGADSYPISCCTIGWLESLSCALCPEEKIDLLL